MKLLPHPTDDLGRPLDTDPFGLPLGGWPAVEGVPADIDAEYEAWLDQIQAEFEAAGRGDVAPW